MFDIIDKTWNPVKGCLHDCTYCWARYLAETKLCNIKRYRDGFKPGLIEEELNKRFHKKFVFVSDMGDLFGSWVPSEWITKVIDSVKQSPDSNFLFLTKNPRRYFEFLELYPANTVFGATIESNREYPVSKAPTPAERYQSMADLPVRNKLISIEPIMDFDMETMTQWIREIGPVSVHVGYDNHNKGLPGPSLSKTMQLIEKLEAFTDVKKLTLRKSEEV
jgi:protein gp37